MRLIFFLALLIGLTGVKNFGWEQTASAGDVQMKSGHRIRFEGKPIPVQGLTMEQIRQGNSGPVTAYPFTMFDAKSRRYYLPQSQVEEVQLGDKYQEQFTLKIPASSRGAMFGSVGGFLNVQNKEFGRRVVTLQGANGPIEVVQSITTLTPQYTEWTSNNYQWQYYVATQTVSPEQLQEAIYLSINTKKQEDRLAVVRFYISAEMYSQAQRELDQLIVDFPDQKARAQELQLEIRQLRAMQFLNEFRRRLAVGQFQTVYELAQKFPRPDVNRSTLQEVDQIIKDHQKALEQIDQVRAQLSRLQAEVKNPQFLQRFQDMRSVVDARLSRNTLERLTPFLQNVDDDFLTAEQKLALAYSAWIVGPALAETDPEDAIHFWDARDRILEFLRTDNPLRSQELLSQLRSIENVGPDLAAAIVQSMGPLHETPPGPIGQPLALQTLTASEPIPYRVLLPLEYSPDRNYPVVVALHAGGLAPEQELLWWGGLPPAGPAHRNGYIVIAPEYAGADEALFSQEEINLRVLTVLIDAKKRFAIDSDRVFLGGHGQGASASLDLGMSHPDLFAGVMAVTGTTNEYTRHYWENCEALAFYVVGGELDGDKFKHNAQDLTRMMKYRYDVVLTEFIQRGNENYLEELPHMLDWMQVHRRAPLKKEISAKTMRHSDHRFYWLDVAGLPQNLIQPRLSRSQKPLPPRPLPLEGKITPGNTIYITAGADRVSLWLNPEIVDFESRMKVQWKGRTVFNDIPERNIETMLEHLRMTGDRQRLYWMRVTF